MSIEKSKELPEHLPMRNHLLSMYGEWMELQRTIVEEKLLNLFEKAPTLESLERLYAYTCAVFLGLDDNNYALIEAIAFLESVENSMYRSLFEQKRRLRESDLQHNKDKIEWLRDELFICK